jgi:hypothetical protein
MLCNIALATCRVMLRITIKEQGESTTIRLEGKLAGPWVEELRQCWRKILAGSVNGNLMAELVAVTYVDSPGKELLREMHRAGTKLVGRGVLTSHMLDEIEQDNAD